MLTPQRGNHQAHDGRVQNRILASIPREEFEGMLPALKPVRLARGDVLSEAGSPVRDCVFPTSGMLSLLLSTEEGGIIEVGMVGNEGMVGVPAFLRAGKEPYRVMVQVAGDALRIRGAALRERASRCSPLHDLLLRYVHALLCQVSQSVVCNRFHVTERRLCRWLLVTSDRVQSDTFSLTQEIIAHMLGVPRTNVTMIMGGLQRKNLIRYTRGQITITDRRGMEAATCECYEVVKKEVSTFFA